MTAVKSSSLCDHGTLIISLDLELFWGMRDKRTLADYGENIRGVGKAIPRMLATFDRYGAKATFATVGLLFFDTKKDLTTAVPTVKPSYKDPALSPFSGHLETLGTDEQHDPYHFGASLIRSIQQHPAHEIACHTFSHYYCLEEGQTKNEFIADLNAAQAAAASFGLQLRSFVFPRNQYREDYLAICRSMGITNFRGNERSWLYAARNGTEESQFRRALRLLDAWVNISGHNCHTLVEPAPGQPLNIPSSRFLRPWNRRSKALEGLRLSRITRAMDHAAATGQVFHLWWHPHNFGRNLEENIAFLEKVLDHFTILREQRSMRSMTMGELAEDMRHGCL